MCGRYVSATPPDQLAQHFGATITAEQVLDAEFNVAPTLGVWTVFDDGSTRRLDVARWGLVPFWADDPRIGNKMINARAETVATKNAFRKPFRKQRCIVPADGFYEWTSDGKTKQPWYIQRTDGEPLAFAGLWETWRPRDTEPRDTEPRDTEPRDTAPRDTAPRDTVQSSGSGRADTGDPADQVLRTCTILTGAANEKMSEIHDRMPIILPPSAWETWLDPAVDDVDLLGTFLVPAPSELITFHPVSTEVNNARNKGAHLTQAVDRPEAPG